MSDNDVVAYAFTVVPWSSADAEWDVGEAFERVSFDDPSETYGTTKGLKVKNVRKLTEK